jgi:arsenate reductase (thioredoxin)
VDARFEGDRMTSQTNHIRVLFLCTGNSCRSQLAEGWVRHIEGGAVEARSAGMESHGLDQRAVQVMAEVGVDISGQRSKRVDELENLEFDYVVTVCDNARESCPLFPGNATVIHTGFDHPPSLAATATGEEEVLGHYRRVRDDIRAFLESFLEELGEGRQCCRTSQQRYN